MDKAWPRKKCKRNGGVYAGERSHLVLPAGWLQGGVISFVRGVITWRFKLDSQTAFDVNGSVSLGMFLIRQSTKSIWSLFRQHLETECRRKIKWGKKCGNNYITYSSALKTIFRSEHVSELSFLRLKICYSDKFSKCFWKQIPTTLL